MKPSCSSKATHRGTCQICGSVQLLPGGFLAKHGYTVKWGFFSGVCPGSGRRPFEISTDAIADAIVGVKQGIKNTQAEIAAIEDLNNPVNDGTKVWKRIYAQHEYRWVKVSLHGFSIDRTSYSLPTSECSYTTLDPVHNYRTGKTERLSGKIEAYDGAWKMQSQQEWARFLNRKYAAELAQNVARRESWLKWQEERVASWAPAPLTPR